MDTNTLVNGLCLGWLVIASLFLLWDALWGKQWREQRMLREVDKRHDEYWAKKLDVGGKDET